MYIRSVHLRQFAEGIVLCVVEGISLEEKSIIIGNGDILVLYTGGVTEAVDVTYQEFGLQRLQRVVATNAQTSAAQILETITDAVESLTGIWNNRMI